ncbi:hypothetical protein JYU12_00790 [bacterium AH-315-K03]|nr:hypothetical protein [bacterium AH-315-K03]
MIIDFLDDVREGLIATYGPDIIEQQQRVQQSTNDQNNNKQWLEFD